jgi:hypothetical protein
MMNTEKGGKRKAGKRRAQTSIKKEDKATKESNIHSHDHCGKHSHSKKIK